jgi:hypothetical protein
LIVAVVALIGLVVIGIVLLVVVRGRQQPATASGPVPEGSIVPGVPGAADSPAVPEGDGGDTPLPPPPPPPPATP